MLALALRLWRLGWHDMWSDEGFTLWMAGLDLPSMMKVLERDAHPPLVYLGLKAWCALFGGPDATGDFAARLPFALAGVGTVAATWWMARPLVGPGAALGAAGCVAVSQTALAMDQEVRFYAFLPLLSTLALGALERRSWRGYALALSLGLYTHYLMGFVLLAQGVGALLSGRGRTWALGAGVAALAFAPWAATMTLAQIRAGAGPPHEAAPLVALAGAGVTLAAGFPLRLPVALLPLLVVPALVGAWALGRAGRALLLFAWLGPPALVWAASAAGPVHFFAAKYLVLAMPAFWTLTAAGLGRHRLLLPLGAVLLILNATSLWLWDTRPEHQKSRWREALNLVAGQVQPGDALVVMNSWQRYVVDRYLRGSGIPVAYVRSEEIDAPRLPPARRLWVLLSHADQVDPHRRFVRWLDARGEWLAEQSLPIADSPDSGVTILLWRPRPQGNSGGCYPGKRAANSG